MTSLCRDLAPSASHVLAIGGALDPPRFIPWR